MNREIKFRAWDKVKKTFPFIGFNIIGEVTAFDMLNQYQLINFIDLEIQQFTGLKDKNGKEVYEGDVFRDTIEVNDLTGDDEYLYYVCAYVKSQSAFCWIGVEDFKLEFHLLETLPEDIEDYCTVTSYDLDKIQIIGNVFEKPELLN